MSPFNQPTKTTLCPLLPTWSSELARVMTNGRRASLPLATRREVKALRAASANRNAERPFRIMNQRRRLFAAYWATPCPSGYLVTRGLIGTPLASRYGQSRPKWLGRKW